MQRKRNTGKTTSPRFGGTAVEDGPAVPPGDGFAPPPDSSARNFNRFFIRPPTSPPARCTYFSPPAGRYPLPVLGDCPPALHPYREVLQLPLEGGRHYA